jgi:hypothetical protein
MGEQAQKKQPEERFLLYIDILNFSNLVLQKGKVEELYEIINDLNVHRHDVFNTIIFGHDPGLQQTTCARTQ